MVRTGGDARSRRRVDAGGHQRGRSVNRCSQPGTRHDEARRAGQAPGRAAARPGRGSHSRTSSDWSGYAARVERARSAASRPARWSPRGTAPRVVSTQASGRAQTGTAARPSSTPAARSIVRAQLLSIMPAGECTQEHNFSNTVMPGANFAASVTIDGGGRFSLIISETTRGWSHTENKTLSSVKCSSAEVIVEAPCCAGSGGILPLADFGTANFANSAANGSAIGNVSPTEITRSRAAPRRTRFPPSRAARTSVPPGCTGKHPSPR
jgi:Peptidase A4 family